MKIDTSISELKKYLHY